MFRVRIHTIDYCLTPPTVYDRDASCAPIPHAQHSRQGHDATLATRVPVIRIFGATPSGEIACAHIHGVFPYMYVPWEVSGGVSSGRVAVLRRGIDKAVGRTTVLAISPVRAIPFYGFHVGFRTYLKVYLLDPAQVPHVADLLRQGRIAGVPPLLPHEAHVPFLLQFMTDYNLFGCDDLVANEVEVRASDPGWGSCRLQVDIAAHSIRNHDAVPERQLHDQIPEPERPARQDQRLMHSLTALWRDVAAAYTKRGQRSTGERLGWDAVSTQEAFAQLGASSSDPRKSPLVWPHDDVFQLQIKDIIAFERHQGPGRPVVGAVENLPTARQAVEEFYPREARSYGVGARGKAGVQGQSKSGLHGVEKAEDCLTTSQEHLTPSQKASDAYRPLSQTFPVAKSAFPHSPQPKASQETEQSSAAAQTPTVLVNNVSTLSSPSQNRDPELNILDPCPSNKEHPARGRKSDCQTSNIPWPSSGIQFWDIAQHPPSYNDVASWLHQEDDQDDHKRTDTERWSESRPLKSPTRAVVEMRTLCLEVHANTRGRFLPNPERDEIQCVFWKVAGGGGPSPGRRSGVVSTTAGAFRPGCIVDGVADERALLDHVIRLVHALDPDVLAGFETTASSWGYLAERAALHGLSFWGAVSRVRQLREVPLYEKVQSVTGRYLLSISKALRAEVALRQYTLEYAAWHVLGRRVPLYRPEVLTAWATSSRPRDVSRILRYHRQRTAISLALVDAVDLIPRTSEQARVLGVDFASVLQRGSQFKVESVMLRVAKPENFVMPSPGKQRVGQQNAAECTPLVLEPRSGLYTSPVVVLDFTSLYPSLMIAYNLCYSTYLGRLDPLYNETKASKTNDRLGFTHYARPPGLLEQVKQFGLVTAPTGMMYVGASTRPSLLARMLAEMLDTRAMVKAAMKTTAANSAERRRLYNRQLALKMLANVTYGYTSASFSGRMPCVEVADSIVQTGRQTLDRAIALIHSVSHWNAEVVYGDTDSLFVHLPGRTLAQAFQLAAEMADAVTAANPHPVRLKVEKVYQPCVLLAKKRYVGYQFDTPEQAVPVFDAKGIETVRRDGSPAASKVLEESLRLLFETADLGRVKTYVQACFASIIRGQLPMTDLCFAREVRAAGAYRAPPPGAIVAQRRAAQDPRSGVLPGERVPYVVVSGPPAVSLRDRCVAPEEVVANGRLQIDSDYYIQKSLIPPLDRVLRLVGVHVSQWYAEMPRVRMPLRAADPGPSQPAPTVAGQQQTLDMWLRGARCARCGQPVQRRRRLQQRQRRQRSQMQGWHRDSRRPALCKRCADDGLETLRALQTEVREAERGYAEVLDGCRSCAGLGSGETVRCENTTCPVFFVRMERSAQARAVRAKAPLVAILARRGLRDLDW